MVSTGVQGVARGAAAAVVSTFVALLSHVGGGGVVPTLTGVVVPLILSLAVCTVLAGRRLSTARLAASVVSSQMLFHVLFVLGSPTDISATDASTTGSGHVHSVVLSSSALHAHSGGQTMWWAHAAAAAITIVALRRGEIALTRLVAVGRLVVASITRDRVDRARSIRPVRIRRAARPTVAAHVVTLHARDGVEPRSRRGPPRPLIVI
jgi:hypothetical protein